VADDAQWPAFAGALGRDDWTRDQALVRLDGRLGRHDELDEGIAAWTSERTPDDVVGALRPLGIPVATVLQVPRMYGDPQLNARGWFVGLDHAIVGARRYPGWPMKFSFSGVHHHFGAPTLGQHNHEILGELGCTEADITQLAERGVIGDRMAI
jgi:crotonobetainyl-CoA:carnitine CoA-transferase CaiB-like acyl-CoA transferase